MGRLMHGLRHLLRGYQQQQDVERLTLEIEKLQRENASMRAGMRRCLTCNYRLACKKLESGVQAGNPRYFSK